ncbi:hypothetical protein V6Z11_A12G166700 [Gossypium hirsutum]
MQRSCENHFTNKLVPFSRLCARVRGFFALLLCQKLHQVNHRLDWAGGWGARLCVYTV